MPKSSSNPQNQQPLGASAGGTEGTGAESNPAMPPSSDAPGQRQQQQATPGEDPASREERIRSAAYDAYVRRGGEPGDEVQDWLDAESQVDGRKG